MIKVQLGKPKLGGKKPWRLILGLILVLLLAAFAGFTIWYNVNLGPVSSSNKPQLFTVDEGSSAHQIADGLKSLGLIRNPRAFIFYVNSQNYHSKLQAGTYKFAPDMSSKTIAKMLATGEIDKNWITVLPGKRLDQIQQVFKQVGYSSSEIAAAFDPANYPNTSAMLGLPAGASFEGFLYPDSYQREKDTPANAIIQEALNETLDHLTADIKNGFVAQGLNDFQGVTLASIVEQESGSPANQPTIAQVFLLRLKQGMMLGSDVTAFYASAIAGQSPSVGIDSPYNTRLHAGLPPGPIGNVTASALAAVAHPATSDYLYFVAGDDGTLHFSHTEAEHEAAIKQYCKKLCQ